MSAKRAISALFATLSLMAIMSYKKSTIKPITYNVYPKDIAKPAIDALRINFNEQIYNANYAISLNEINLPAMYQSPRVIETTTTKNGVRYIFNNGDCIERRGGTLAWRNNNPGCIRYSTQAVEMGATGKSNGFAVFPDEKTGMRAIGTLLRSDKYSGLTIGAAITKYAPPHENDTRGYIRHLCNMTGLSNNLKICDLDDEQLGRVIAAIRTIEGWREGTETKIQTIQHKLEHTM